MTKTPAKTVYLVDISFFIFRAYHALPPLKTSEGLPTGVIHGVASMFERLIREENPHYLAAIFDTSRKTFRNDLYPEYKANRDEPDEDLRVQFPYVRKLVDALAVFQAEQHGFEADDLIATLAKRFSSEDVEVVIVSGDKDLMQCVRRNVSLLDPVKGKRVRHKEVKEKFGVAPEQVADVLGLIGDASDNFPGVKGVGPKTAALLLEHFGSLDAMLERTAEIETLPIRGAAGVRKKIEEGVEMALLCRRLATVADEVPLEVSLEDLLVRPVDGKLLTALSKELELRRLPQRLGVDVDDPVNAPGDVAAVGESRRAASKAAGGKSPGTTSNAVTSGPPDAQGVLLVAAGPAASGDWRKLVGKRLEFVLRTNEGFPFLCVAAGATRAVVSGANEVAEAFRGLAEDPTTEFIGFDLKAPVRLYGISLGEGGLDLGVASYLVDASGEGHGPAEMCARYIGEDLVAEIETPAQVEAALAQVARLAKYLEPELAARDQARLYRELEHPLVEVLGKIEAAGILLDTGMLAKMSKDLGTRMHKLVAEVYEAAGEEFNVLSPVQLRQILFEKLGLSTKGIKKTKTGPSTDSDSLMALAPYHALPQLVLAYRAMAKLKSTYVDSLPRMVDAESRIHTTLHQTVTVTGRLSSSDPNLQNIPIRSEEGKLIRGAFVAPAGAVIVSADYNQIELRVLAHLSEDEALIEAFVQGEDIHRKTAREIFETEQISPDMRRQAKVINFGIIYGMGPVRLSRELGISRVQAGDYIKRYFERYPGVQRFYAQMLEQARERGWVGTLMGRRRYLPDINSDHGGQRQFAERVATNTPIQGSAADIIKLAMIGLSGRLGKVGPDVRMVLQIHDELLLECPKNKQKQVIEMTREAMEEAAELKVPVVVDVSAGASWAEAH